MMKILLSLILGSLPVQQDLVIALKPDKNPEAMFQERQRLEKLITSFGPTAKVVVPLSSAVILEGLSNGSIDVAYLSSLDMVNAQEAGIAEVLLAGRIEGKTSYESYWVSLADKPYKSIADLKGKPIAFASRTSTSGYLIPHADLIEQGLLKPQQNPEAFFGNGNVWYGSGYVSGIERVLAGQAEAAAVSDYVMLKDKHLTPEQKSRLRVMDRQGPIPTHVLAVRSSLAESRKKELKNILLKMNEAPHQELRNRVFTSELVDVLASEHLKGTSEALRLTGAKL
jgi:phosphonate transport system substrate-binding protein